jgi:hypothetical protein
LSENPIAWGWRADFDAGDLALSLGRKSRYKQLLIVTAFRQCE